MPDTPLFHRLKQRKIVQRGLAYLAGAFLVFQVVEVLAEPWSIPPTLQRSIHILLLAGFFVQLVIAWYHGEKGQQHISGTELILLAGVLLATGAAISLLGTGREANGSGAAESRPSHIPSIAVLPFANLSPDPDDSFFADGVHEEILTQLSKISGIRVVSRTSVMSYRETTKTLRTVSEELGVQHILEGSVRRFQNRVRINVKLFDTDAAQQVWADDFERDRENLFDIQAEVAERIATTLRAELSPAELARLAARPTENTEAHDFWLRGNEYNRAGENQPRGPRGVSWELAAGMYRRAAELDPSFAAAWARLSYQHSRIHWYGYDPRDARRDSARVALDRAVRLNPEDPEVLTAMGYYNYRIERDYDAAVRQYRRALEDLPGDVQLINIIALVRRRQGRLLEAAQLLARGFESDPRNGSLAEEAGNTFRAARAWEEALSFLDRAIALSPDYPDGYLRKADLLLSWRGDIAGARATLEAGAALSDSADFLVSLYYMDLFEGKFSQALERIDASAPELIDEQYNLIPRDLLAGLALHYAGSEMEAKRRLEGALQIMERIRSQQPEDPRVHRALGLIHGALGHAEAAMSAANKAVDMMPMGVDAWVAGDMIENRAWTFALLRQTDLALADLEFLLETPTRSWISSSLLEIDPRWQGFRSEQRFLSLVSAHAETERH